MVNEMESGVPEEAQNWKAPDLSAESEEKKYIRREYEYRGVDGQLLGRAIIEVDPSQKKEMVYQTKEGEKSSGVLLKSFIIESEKDGQLKQRDVLALANLHNVEVFVAEERLRNYCCNNDATRVEAPPLETPIDVGVLLHELGHADQYHDPRFDKVNSLNEKARKINDQKEYYYKSKDLEEIMEVFPQVREVLGAETIKKVNDLDEELSKLVNERNAVEDEMDNLAVAKRNSFRGTLRRLIDRQLPTGDSLKVFEQAFKEGDDSCLDIFSKMGFDLPDKDAVTPYDAFQIVNQFRKSFAENAKYDSENQRLQLEAKCLDNKVRVILSLPMMREEYDNHQAYNSEIEQNEQLLNTQFHQKVERIKLIGEESSELIKKLNIKDIVVLPMRVLERDATRRAFDWLRTIQQQDGINILRTIQAGKGKLDFGEDDRCEQSVKNNLGEDESATMSIREELNRALKSYKSEKVKMRDKEGRRKTMRVE